jgi:hypothetical protein
MECNERVRSADVHEALIAFFKKRPPDLQHRRGYSQGSSSLKELRASATELTCLVKQRESQSQVGAEGEQNARVGVSYSTSITGTCDCFAGARLLVSRCGDRSISDAEQAHRDLNGRKTTGKLLCFCIEPDLCANT